MRGGVPHTRLVREVTIPHDGATDFWKQPNWTQSSGSTSLKQVRFLLRLIGDFVRQMVLFCSDLAVSGIQSSGGISEKETC